MATRRKGRWFKPKRTLYGWAANKSQLSRRRALGRRAKVTGWLSVGRALVALSNATRDALTRRAARGDSRYAFEQHRRERRGKGRAVKFIFG
jgi:hypothetical protein